MTKVKFALCGGVTLLVLALVAVQPHPAFAQFGDAPANETEVAPDTIASDAVPDNATSTDEGNATAAEAGAYNQGVDACIYADHPLSILETAGSNPAFSVLVAAVNATGLGSALDSTTDKVTVFAPTDDAFAFFLEASNLTAEEALANTDLLSKILKYHVVPDVVGFDDMQSGAQVATVEGSSLTVAREDSGAAFSAFGVPLSVPQTVVKIQAAASEATIVQGNVWACSGVIQVIDAVLVPDLSSAQ